MRLTKNKFIHRILCTFLAGVLFFGTQSSTKVYAEPVITEPPRLSYALSTDSANHVVTLEPLVTSTEPFQVYLMYPDSKDWVAIDNTSLDLTETGSYKLKATSTLGAETQIQEFEVTLSDLALDFDISSGNLISPLHVASEDQADALLWQYPTGGASYPDGTYESYWRKAVAYAAEKGNSNDWSSAVGAKIFYSNGTQLYLNKVSPYCGIGNYPNSSYKVDANLAQGQYTMTDWDLVNASGAALGDTSRPHDPFGIDTEKPNLTYNLTPVNGGKSYQFSWSYSDNLSGVSHGYINGGGYPLKDYWISEMPNPIVITAKSTSQIFTFGIYD